MPLPGRKLSNGTVDRSFMQNGVKYDQSHGPRLVYHRLCCLSGRLWF